MSRRQKPLIPQKNLGKISMAGGYKSTTTKFVSEKQLEDFVQNEMQTGPQIVSLPVPPQRHAILVDIQKERIMVSDWNGPSVIKTTRHLPAWKQYWDFFSKLQKKYPGRPLQYYPVDPALYKTAFSHSQVMGGGGCSFYLFAWIAQSPLYEKWTV